MSTTPRILAVMGYDESPAARAERLGIRPAMPVSPDREWRRNERKRRTLDDVRADMRRDILDNDRLLADPENEWRRDQLERNRRHHVLRYRLAISSMMGLPSLPFPVEASTEIETPQPFVIAPRPALRLVTKETAHV